METYSIGAYVTSRAERLMEHVPLRALIARRETSTAIVTFRAGTRIYGDHAPQRSSHAERDSHGAVQTWQAVASAP